MYWNDKKSLLLNIFSYGEWGWGAHRVLETRSFWIISYQILLNIWRKEPSKSFELLKNVISTQFFQLVWRYCKSLRYYSGNVFCLLHWCLKYSSITVFNFVGTLCKLLINYLLENHHPGHIIVFSQLQEVNTSFSVVCKVTIFCIGCFLCFVFPYYDNW